MAELDFSHNVPEVPAGQPLPAPYRRSEGVQVTQQPDVQGAVSNYAENTNWMSFIGSAVASKASNAVAQKVGTELGKNPQGDMGIPLTDFDKVMQESYRNQANATLGLQANKLIVDSSLEAAKADRITPDLIKKTNQNIAIGLQNIFKQAPSEIVGQLEYHYGSLQLNQSADLTQKMIGQQKQDRKNQASLASQQYAENAYSFGMRGNDKAAQALIQTTKNLAASQVAVTDISPEEAKSRVDTVRRSYLNGKIAHDIDKARSEGKQEALLKDIADGKYISKDSPDYISVSNYALSYINQQESLRSQDQSLALAKFNTSVAMNPLSPDMPQQFEQLKSHVSPQVFEKAKLHYINSVKTYNEEQGNVNNAISAWNDPDAFARLSDKGINKAFDIQVARYIQQRQSQGSPISLEEAEVQVAASAGGHVPVFQKSLENKLLSGSPQSIVSAVNQIDMLDKMEQGRVYSGVSQKGKAIATLFQQQRGSMPDNDLARQITDNLSNVDDKMQKTLDNSWNLILSSKYASGISANKSLADFALIEVGLVPPGEYGTKNKHETFGGSYFATIYGNDIYNQLNSNFIATRGDYTAAVKMTKDYTEQHYGDTFINGEKQKTDSPIEKALGYKGNSVTPFIQKDLLNQLQGSFDNKNYTIRETDKNGKENTILVSAKEAFEKKIATEYWETLPLKGDVAEVLRHIRTKEGIKTYRYPINLVGHAGNQWDVVVQTPTSHHNLFLVAPHIGVSSYVPNKEAIDKDFKENGPKGWFHGR